MTWPYLLLGIVAWPFIKLLAKAINHEIVHHRQRKFLKLVSVMFPGNEKITLITIDTTDKRAMKRLERQLREQFEVE
jgi:hypothetical protein